MGKISIRDVARLAGVSISTVSFVYHDPNRVKTETREAVLQVAKQLGYVPNLSASGLRGKTNLVALVINFNYDEMHHPTTIESLPYISQYLKEHGYYMMLFFIPPLDTSEELISLAKTRQIAGLMYMASRTNLELLDLLIEYELPVVSVGTLENYKDKIFCIDNNNIEDTYNLVLHTHKLGYKKIAFLSGDLDYIVCQQRLDGYKKAINELQIHEPIIFGYCENKDDITQSVQEIINSPSKPDAIITKDDIKAVYVISKLLKMGIKVGKEIGVSSIGGISITTYTTPQISSMSFSIKEIAHKAVQALHNNILKNHSITGINFVESQFIERGSLNKNNKNSS